MDTHAVRAAEATGMDREALADHLSREFGLETFFLDLPTLRRQECEIARARASEAGMRAAVSG